MIKYIFFTLLLLICITTSAQEVADTRNQYFALNTFYIEGLGKAGNVSLNYERRHILNEKQAISGQIGVGPDVSAMKVPITFVYTRRKKAHQLVAGFGKTVYFDAGINNSKYIYHKLSYSLEDSFWHIQLGYRYQPGTGGVFAQILYTPLFGSEDAPGPLVMGIHHWVGVSLGYSLKNTNVK